MGVKELRSSETELEIRRKEERDVKKSKVKRPIGERLLLIEGVGVTSNLSRTGLEQGSSPISVGLDPLGDALTLTVAPSVSPGNSPLVFSSQITDEFSCPEIVEVSASVLQPGINEIQLTVEKTTPKTLNFVFVDSEGNIVDGIEVYPSEPIGPGLDSISIVVRDAVDVSPIFLMEKSGGEGCIYESFEFSVQSISLPDIIYINWLDQSETIKPWYKLGESTIRLPEIDKGYTSAEFVSMEGIAFKCNLSAKRFPESLDFFWVDAELGSPTSSLFHANLLTGSFSEIDTGVGQTAALSEIKFPFVHEDGFLYYIKEVFLSGNYQIVKWDFQNPPSVIGSGSVQTGQLLKYSFNFDGTDSFLLISNGFNVLNVHNLTTGAFIGTIPGSSGIPFEYLQYVEVNSDRFNGSIYGGSYGFKTGGIGASEEQFNQYRLGQNDVTGPLLSSSMLGDIEAPLRFNFDRDWMSLYPFGDGTLLKWIDPSKGESEDINNDPTVGVFSVPSLDGDLPQQAFPITLKG